MEKMKYLSVLLKVLRHIFIGNYINFAICEYYQDDTFAKLSHLILNTAISVDYVHELKAFPKLHAKVFAVLCIFF